MNDVAIIGVGLHPFGRFEGKPAMQMGTEAIFAAVADAGVEWKDIEFGVGGSWTVANPDAIVSLVGLTGIPFTDVFNASRPQRARQRRAPTVFGWVITTSESPSAWTSIHEVLSPRIPRWSGCRGGTPRTGNTSPRSSSG
jgi:hypothetical protein